MRFMNSVLSRCFRISLIAAILDISVAAVHSQDSPPPEVQEQGRGSNKAKQPPEKTTQSEPQPVVIQGTVETTTQPSAAEIERQRQEKPKTIWEDPAWFSAIAAGAAAFFALLAFGAALWQACITRQTMRLNHRAWVTISRAVVGFQETQEAGQRVATAEIGKPLPIHMTIGNSGRTPALELRIAAACFFLPEVNQRVIERMTSTLDPLEGGTIVVGPGVDFIIPIHTNRNFTMEDVKGIGNDRFVIVSGRIEYTDIFNRRHATLFRFHASLKDIADGIIAFVGSQSGNRAD